MASNFSQLNGGRYLASLWQTDSVQAAFQSRIIKAINTLAGSLGSNAVGEAPPPPPVSNINVNVSGEIAQITLDQNKAVTRPINYFSEIDTDPNFPNPLIMHHGPSRAPAPFSLPTYDAAGNKHSYYLRSYCQYPGSKPSAITTFGGANGAVPITMGGQTKMDLLQSTGSGTSSGTGQQAGQGFGTQPYSTPAVGAIASIVSSPNAPAVAPTSGPQLVLAIIDFTQADGPQDTTARVTVPVTWVTASSIILAAVLAGTADHPDPDEPAVEGIVVSVGNIVAGVSFEVSAYAPNGTWGQYYVACIGA